MRRIGTVSFLLATAGGIWAATFFAIAYGFTRLVAAVEGDTSECSRAECGFLGRVQSEHDVAAAIAFAALAGVPSCLFLWRAWRFANRSAKLFP